MHPNKCSASACGDYCKNGFKQKITCFTGDAHPIPQCVDEKFLDNAFASLPIVDESGMPRRIGFKSI